MHPFAVEIPRCGAGLREVSNLYTALRLAFVYPMESGGPCDCAVQQDEVMGTAAFVKLSFNLG